MSLSMTDNVQTATRRDRPVARMHAPGTRRRLRNARRALALVTDPNPDDHGVRLHPVELGPWDD